MTAFETSGHILDVADAAHRSCAPRGAMHAASIELDHSFFVRQAAQSDAVVVWIVFRTLYHANRSVERVAAAFKEVESRRSR